MDCVVLMKKYKEILDKYDSENDKYIVRVDFTDKKENLLKILEEIEISDNIKFINYDGVDLNNLIYLLNIDTLSLVEFIKNTNSNVTLSSLFVCDSNFIEELKKSPLKKNTNISVVYFKKEVLKKLYNLKDDINIVKELKELINFNATLLKSNILPVKLKAETFMIYALNLEKYLACELITDYFLQEYEYNFVLVNFQDNITKVFKKFESYYKEIVLQLDLLNIKITEEEYRNLLNYSLNHLHKNALEFF